MSDFYDLWVCCDWWICCVFMVFLWFEDFVMILQVFGDLRILLWFCELFLICGFVMIGGSWWFPDLLLWFASLLWFANFLLWFVGLVVICRFVMICGFVSSLTWLILMLQAYVSEISSANHQALGVSIVWSLFLYSFLLVFVGSRQLLLNYEQ